MMYSEFYLQFLQMNIARSFFQDHLSFHEVIRKPFWHFRGWLLENFINFFSNFSIYLDSKLLIYKI